MLTLDSVPRQNSEREQVKKNKAAKDDDIEWGKLAMLYVGPLLFVLLLWFAVHALPDTGARDRIGNRRLERTFQYGHSN